VARLGPLAPLLCILLVHFQNVVMVGYFVNISILKTVVFMALKGCIIGIRFTQLLIVYLHFSNISLRLYFFVDSSCTEGFQRYIGVTGGHTLLVERSELAL
jgi:hypothetical protein